MRIKEGSEKAGLKLNIKKLRSWLPVPSLYGKQRGKKWKLWPILFSWAPKSLRIMSPATTLKDACSLEEKLWKTYRAYWKAETSADKGPYSQAMFFPVVTCGCESWTIKNVEHWRIDAFELWCWRRLLRVPWTARRSNQSMLKKINPNTHCKDWCWS